MGRFRALVAYDGTDFFGWQIQPTVRTVEGELTTALARISQRISKVQGASRTDAGVHAEGQVIHFDYQGRMTAAELLRGLNALSGPDVALLRCETAADSFHARHDARGKLYRFDLWADRIGHPLFRRTTLHVPYRLDLDAMRQAAGHLVGEHDFSCFRASTCDAPSPRLRLSRLELVGNPPLLQFLVEGTAFLKYMVRTLVGTLLEVGRGRRSPDSMVELLQTADRTQAGETVGPRGLHLVRVDYEQRLW
ncbi:MAG: tRNA pseudouridine(38-40) synthase TruA [Bradymonadales bacterium]|nr:tRNA pseudouridine(38-40) synthase TruA [Bradymonadales bacterium]